jgi:hypothetical protein
VKIKTGRTLLSDDMTPDEFEQIHKPALDRFAEIFEAGRSVDFAWDD